MNFYGLTFYRRRIKNVRSRILVRLERVAAEISCLSLILFFAREVMERDFLVQVLVPGSFPAFFPLPFPPRFVISVRPGSLNCSREKGTRFVAFVTLNLIFSRGIE